MRFKKEAYLRKCYLNNTKKTETKFLWWPVKIDGETRWLERATIEYKVETDMDIFLDRFYYWKPWRFINE